MKRNLALTLVFILMISLVLTACQKEGEGAVTPTPTKDTLTVAIKADPRSLEPHNGSNDADSTRVQNQIYETLVVLNVDKQMEGSLAKSWEYTDDTTLVMKIRENVKFHNGESFDANDALFSLKNAVTGKYTSQLVDDIDFDNTKVVDSNTLQIKTNKPTGILLAKLCSLYMYDEQTFNEVGEEGLASRPIGTGPFMFKEWYRGDRIELEAFQDYWATKPSFKKLVMRVISEPSSRAIEVESGGVDIAVDIVASDLDLLATKDNVKVLRTPSWGNVFIGFNCKEGPFTNKALRQAINYALDREAIVKGVYGNSGKLAAGPMPESFWGYNPDLKGYSRNIEKAKELLTQAGYSDGLTITLTTSDSQERVDIAEMVQNQLGQVDITVKVETLENATYLDRIVAGTVEMYILGWTCNTGDPHFALFDPFYTGGATWANTAQYSNSEVDRLLDIGRNTVDENTRLDAYYEVQELLVDEAPWVFLQNSEYTAATTSAVKGFVVMPSVRVSFNTVTFQ